MKFNPEVIPIRKNQLFVFFKRIDDLKKDGTEWIFRGCKIKHLEKTNYFYFEQIFKTAFDRYIKDWQEIDKDKKMKIDKRCLEAEIIRDFQRRFSISESSDRPPDDDLLSWLALMRHHGAPTRLLDFSYSPYMALFFAFDSMFNSSAEKCVVLAIKRNWFTKAINGIEGISKQKIKKIEGNDKKTFIFLFYRPKSKPIDFIYTVIPYDLNPRMALQGGLFLCPGNIEKTCFKNFENMKDDVDKEHFKLYVFGKEMTPEVFEELRRMDISKSSVYPGMDGYAKSTWTRFPILSRISEKHEWSFYKQFFFDRLIKGSPYAS
ncbi:MAG: FRG domain-containing protein [Deltaproteobacteria bacterium]|nr:FRG domain-containing protein [Deltaproteobacteria bacterium]